MTVELTYHEQIAVLHMGADENRFSQVFLDQVEEGLDSVLSNGAQALVTSADGKFYSNGLDLDWLLAHGDQVQAYGTRVEALFSRVLTLPIPTVAAVSGHAFGAGAMLATAHDFRVMRSDRGYFCFPEVDIRIPFSAGMAALIQAKLAPHVAVIAMTTGRRFVGPEALALHIIDSTAAEGEVTRAAIELVAPLGGKDPDTLGAIKGTMFAAAVAALASGPESLP